MKYTLETPREEKDQHYVEQDMQYSTVPWVPVCTCRNRVVILYTTCTVAKYCNFGIIMYCKILGNKISVEKYWRQISAVHTYMYSNIGRTL